METKDGKHLGIRIEESIIKKLDTKVQPFSSRSDLVRNILREWVKKNCESAAK